MKTNVRFLLAAAGILAALPALRAADDEPASKEEKKALRVLTAPERERRVLTRDGERREKAEKETVAFLGVETAPISATTSSQLGLPRGTGLAVLHIVAKSPAAGVLNENDILLKLDDQILIEVRQLSVLVRTHKEGDEVVLTYLRGGQKATATVKLGKTEVPKISGAVGSRLFPFGAGGANNVFEYRTSSDEERADLDQVLSMIQGSPDGDPVRIQIDRHAAPGFRALAVHTGNSSMTFSDQEGSLELTMREGAKNLVAKNARGDQVFAGPVNTPEERKAMPADVRARLEKLEGMHDITFRTDGDFQGAEMKIMHPRSILFVRPTGPSSAPATFY